jgi:hypothetical protein
VSESSLVGAPCSLLPAACAHAARNGAHRGIRHKEDDSLFLVMTGSKGAFWARWDVSYRRSTMASAKAEVLTSWAPSVSRAKS